LNIPEIQTKDDIDQYLKGRDIDLVKRENAPLYHVPVFVFIFLLFKIIGLFKSNAPDPERYWQTLPCFDGTVHIYFDEKVQPFDSLPTLVHELTHAEQIRRDGAIKYALGWTVLPFIIGYTFGSTYEWEAQGNAFLWWHNRGARVTDKYLKQYAQKFCGPTYLWRGFDADGMHRAWVRLIRSDAETAFDVDYTDMYGGFKW